MHGAGTKVGADVRAAPGRTDERVLVLSGALDVRCTADLRDRLYELIEGERSVVVDLGAVESIDVTTLKLLAVAHRSAERSGGRVVLRAPGPAVRRLLHLTHLRSLLPVEPAPGPGVSDATTRTGQ